MAIPPARNAEPVVNSSFKKRTVTSIDGPVEVQDTEGYCPACRRPFSPDREALGFDARELTPLLIQRMTFAAAETCSFKRAGLVMKNVGNQPVSAKTIERVVHDVGWELAERRDADPKTADALAQRPEIPPDLAVVECDEGRIRTREPGHGPGVHRTTEGWRETKNACLICAQRKTFGHDPQPEPPECFCNPKHVAKIAETEALPLRAAAGVLPPEVTVERTSIRRRRWTPPTGVPNDSCARSSAAWRLPKISASKWRGKRNGDGSSRPRRERSWATVCPGTGRSGKCTSLTSQRSSISFTC